MNCVWIIIIYDNSGARNYRTTFNKKYYERICRIFGTLKVTKNPSLLIEWAAIKPETTNQIDF